MCQKFLLNLMITVCISSIVKKITRQIIYHMNEIDFWRWEGGGGSSIMGMYHPQLEVITWVNIATTNIFAQNSN